MAVRYDKNFMAEINRIINAYNRKITRLGKVGGYELPQRFTNNDINIMKATAVSRADVRRRLKDLQSFTARGGEKTITIKGNKIPKYQYANIKRYQRLLKVQTTRKLKEFETRKPRLNAKVQPFTFAQYGSQEYLTLRAKRELLLEKDIKNMSFKERQNYIETLRVNTKTVNLDLWRNNFLTIFQDTALSYGYDPTKLEIINTILNKLNPEQIDDLTFIDKNIKEVIYGYRKLENIKTASQLETAGKEARKNLDQIFENLPTLVKDYLSTEDYTELVNIYKKYNINE